MKVNRLRGIKVRNMAGVPNQFEIDIPGIGTVFQSYHSVIAIRSESGEITLDESDWDYSNTTGRYRNLFLGEGIAETRKKIKSGVYKLADLN